MGYFLINEDGVVIYVYDRDGENLFTMGTHWEGLYYVMEESDVEDDNWSLLLDRKLISKSVNELLEVVDLETELLRWGLDIEWEDYEGEKLDEVNPEDYGVSWEHFNYGVKRCRDFFKILKSYILEGDENG